MLFSRNSRIYTPWECEGGRSSWPLVLLADRGITLVGTKVSAWADVVTGNALAATQANSLRQGIWTPSSALFKGQPCIDFSAGGGMSVPAFVRTNMQPFTLYTVSPGYDTNARYFFDGSAVRFTAYYYPSTWTVQGTGDACHCEGLNTQHVRCFKAKSGTVELWSDGIKQTVTGTTTYDGINNLQIGQRKDEYDVRDWRGPWAALLIHDGIDDDPATARVLRWLTTRFGEA
jgi:hypothetical protein